MLNKNIFQEIIQFSHMAIMAIPYHIRMTLRVIKETKHHSKKELSLEYMNSSDKLSRSVEKQNPLSTVMMSYSEPGHETKLVHDGFYIDGYLYGRESACEAKPLNLLSQKAGQKQSV